jgi:EAL domain-containing protein (putative c-di-GMP-specific phosphodiesterase class I)
VETDDQLNAVVSMGISAVQGYYYSKPLGATELQKTVAEINQIANGQKLAAK